MGNFSEAEEGILVGQFNESQYNTKAIFIALVLGPYFSSFIHRQETLAVLIIFYLLLIINLFNCVKMKLPR